MVLFYALFLLLFSSSILWFSGDGSKAMITLQNILLIASPLIALVYSTMYFYNSNDFIALLLTQPIKRSRVFWSLNAALSLSLSMALLVGLGLPLLFFSTQPIALSLLSLTLMLNLVFVALGLWVSNATNDRTRGLGFVLLIWLFFTLLYDGLALFVLYWFQEYPLMTPILLITSLNPVDLARVNLLLQMDISALMGLTGAVFKDFFSSGLGSFISGCLLLLWILIPNLVAARKFQTKNF